MPRYIIADPSQGFGWGHIFVESDEGRSVTRERITRFVYDTEDERLIHLDISRNDHLVSASDVEMADLEDSLQNANPEALQDPNAWGLLAGDNLPEWCAAPESVPAP